MIDVQISQLLQKPKSVYYQESLGGVPGGERVPAVEGERRVVIRIVGVFIWNPSWNSRIVCTYERERYRGRVQS